MWLTLGGILFARRRIAILAVVLAVIGTLVTWAALSRGHTRHVAEPSSSAAERHDPDRDADKGGDPDAGDPDAGEGGETAAIKNALEWYYGQRTVPGRALPSAALSAARVQAARIPTYQASGVTPATAPAWTALGPRPTQTSGSFDSGEVAAYGFGDVSGRITSLAAVPGTNQIAYAGAADGGVWKTTDGGTTWAPVSDKLATLAIGAITVPTANPNTVWVGTGEANTSSDAYYGAGIYRSTDGGATWIKRGGTTFNQASVFKIVIGRGFVLAATSHGLYRTTDSGTTWSAVLAPGGGSDPYGNFVTDTVVLPGFTGSHVLAAVGWRGGDTSNGLWLSTDSGATFAKVAPSGFAAQANIGRMSLAVTPTAEYAVVQDAVLFNNGSATDGLNGVYRSTAGPAGPWTRIATGTSLLDGNSQVSYCFGEHAGVQAWYDQYLAVDPTNKNHLVLGLEEIYDSADGGTTWHTIGRYADNCSGGSLTTHPDQHAAAFGVAGGVPTLYVGNDGGVWKQTGATLSNSNWVDLNAGLSILQPYYVAASAGPNPTIIAGTQDNGTVLGTPASQTWNGIKGGDGGAVAIVPNTPTSMYEEYTYLSMYRSTNGGSSWTNVRPPDGGNGNAARFIAPFMLDPTDPNHLVALGQHVWEDHNGTNVSWTQSYDNGSGHVGTALDVRGSTIYEGWCGPCNPSALTSDSPFARGLATNAGGTWHAVAAAGLPNRYVSGILIDPANSNHVYVAMSGFSRRWIPGGGLGHVFESTDGGASFTDISGNLPDAPANDLVLSRGKLVVATDVGVYRRTPTGSWAKFGTGMPVLSVLDLTVVPGTNTILAASHGRGIWSLAA
jgi:photosystem II stability/assembly factor-like uncharacterized protein